MKIGKVNDDIDRESLIRFYRILTRHLGMDEPKFDLFEDIRPRRHYVYQEVSYKTSAELIFSKIVHFLSFRIRKLILRRIMMTVSRVSNICTNIGKTELQL